MIVAITCLSLSLLFIFESVSSLDADATPGENFDLSNWKITLPDASERSPDELEAGFENNYFKTGGDGSMRFYVTPDASTENAIYSRSELRQLCNPDPSGSGSYANPDRYNWKVTGSGTNTVSGKYKIGNIDDDSRKIIIQQIHAYDGPPLVKIKWEKDKVYALVKTDSSGDNEESYEMGDAKQHSKFKVKTTVKDGYLKLYLDDVRIYNIKVSSYWSSYGNYFKAGNYLQSTDSSAYAYVYVYWLSLTQDLDGCDYTSDSFTLDDDSNGIFSNPTTTGIAVTIFIIIGLAICGISGYCYYKKKYLPSKGQASFENDADAKTDSDGKNDNKKKESTSGGDSNGDGNTPVANSQEEPAYDMTQIEINVDVEQ